MTLDDLFAKKAKKKIKKKNNPQDLLEKLTKEVSKQQDVGGDVAAESTKTVANLGKDDEWEAFDDEEKDIDLEALQLGKLALGSTEAKQPSKEKSDHDTPGEAEAEKKVWGAKAPEAPVVEEPVVEEQPPAKPSVYVPVHLRQSGAKTIQGPKPDLESTADFPTLDAAGNVEPAPVKAKTKEEEEEEASWAQAGAPRKPARASDMLPIAVNPAPSSYVPPGLRSSASSSVAARAESTFSTPPRDDFVRRSDARRSEGYALGDSPFASSSGSGWSRGETIIRDSIPSGAPTTNPLTTQPRSNFGGSGSTGGGSGWERGVVMKTFRETGRDKAQFELVQSNRFAGLGET